MFRAVVCVLACWLLAYDGPVLRVGSREHNILDTSGCRSTNAMILDVLAFPSTHRKRSGRGARIKGREAGGRERGGAAATRTAALVCCCYLSAAYGRLAAAFTTVVVPPLPQPLVSSTHGERVLFPAVRDTIAVTAC